MSPQISVKTPNMKFHENPSCKSRCSGILMARRTQMTKAILSFADCFRTRRTIFQYALFHLLQLSIRGLSQCSSYVIYYRAIPV